MTNSVPSEQRQIIKEQAENAKKTIESLDADDVRLEVKKRLGPLIDEFELLYDMLYLEARLIAQKYYMQKVSAPEFGHTYGYLNANVGMLRGTIQARFQARYPTTTKGEFKRTFLKKNKTGYSRVTLGKIAAHDYELDNAMAAEAGFETIRRDADFVKKTIRRMKDLQSSETHTIQGNAKA
jgi:hypothetical protein